MCETLLELVGGGKTSTATGCDEESEMILMIPLCPLHTANTLPHHFSLHQLSVHPPRASLPLPGLTRRGPVAFEDELPFRADALPPPLALSSCCVKS